MKKRQNNTINEKEPFKKTCSLKQLETILGIAKSRIYNLVSEGWLPKPQKSKWDVCECVSGYVTFLKDTIVHRNSL